jgi:uncharacterized protein (TIGR03067 family)
MPAADAIEGTWQIEKAELAGEEMPALVAGKIEVELAAGQYAVRFAGDVSDRGTYELGAPAAVRAITLTGIAGTNAGRTIPAIYQFTGEQLHICYGLDGVAPGGFATRAGAALFLAVYQRKK